MSRHNARARFVTIEDAGNPTERAARSITEQGLV